MELFQLLYLKYKYRIFILLLIFSACTNSNNNLDKEESVFLNTEQINNLGIKTGSLSIETFSKIIECSGYIDVSPSHKASVAAPVNGFVKSIFYYPGNFVNKGAVLAVLEHSDYIKLQEEYLEIKNKLEYYKSEFSRQGELTIDNATSIKVFQKAQVDYRSTNIKFLSLKAQLKFIGLNPDSLSAERIQSCINLYAPISGYITKINANIGELIDSQKSLYEIDDLSNLSLFIKIKESNINYLEPNQKVMFNTKNDNKEFTAKVKFINQTLDKENNTININADIDSSYSALKLGMIVNCKLYYDKFSNYAINKKAIIKKDENNFIIINVSNSFMLKSVTTGIMNAEFIEIIKPDKDLLNNKIVIDGVKSIYSQIKKHKA